MNKKAAFVVSENCFRDDSRCLVMHAIFLIYHFISSGVFCLIQAFAFIKYLRDQMTKSEFKHLFNFALIGFAGVVFLAVVGLTYLGMYTHFIFLHRKLAFLFL